MTQRDKTQSQVSTTNHNPMVSVVMPFYNRSEYLDDAIQSILHQTFSDFEFIIVNDGSSEQSRSFVTKYNDPKIVLLDNEKNIGISASRNRANSIAQGKYIIVMDSDDVSDPTRIEKQVAFMEANPNIDICGSYYRYMDTGDVVTHPIWDEEIKIALLQGCPIMHGSSIIRRSSFVVNNIYYDEKFISAQDYDLLSRFANILTYHNIPVVLDHCRRHSGRTIYLYSGHTFAEADIIRNRELDKIIPERSQEESENHCLIAKRDFTEILDRFKDQTRWLEKLKNKNMNAKYFSEPLFKKFITELTSVIEKGYADKIFIFAKHYNLRLLYEFLWSSLQPYKFYSLQVRLKIIAKCLLHKSLQKGNKS